MEVALKDGHLDLGAGPWSHETFAVWKDEHPRCLARAVNVPDSLIRKAFADCLAASGHRVEGVACELEADCDQLRRSDFVLV